MATLRPFWSPLSGGRQFTCTMRGGGPARSLNTRWVFFPCFKCIPKGHIRVPGLVT